MFADVPVLQRKWQAALRPGEDLPRYEDVMLGSLGRLADHIVLLRNDDGTLEVSRTGRYVQQWLDDDRWDIPLSALPPDCATALGEAAASALQNGRPYLAAAHCVRDGTGADLRRAGAADRVALGRHADRRLCQRARRRNTICSIRSSRPPTRASCRWRRSAIRAAARSISRSSTSTRAPRGCWEQPATALLWRRLSAGGNLLCAPRGDRAAAATSSAAAMATSSRSTAMTATWAGGDGLRRHAVADGLGRHGAEAARSLVPAAVRQQSDADVGVRCRDDPIPQRQRRRGQPLRLQPRNVPAACSCARSGRRTNG